MKTFTSLFLFSLCTNVFASKFIAEAVKIRGEVTQLSPGSKSAKIINEGDKFLEDTSILTSSKSFIKIKFIDNSEINLGPESKIVISEMKPNEPGIISLLKGKIRTSVEKNPEKDENKFFIKTRTAAMGVRGTEFQTIYNPENKVTSLLTYHGAVKMAKIDDNQYKKIEDAENKSNQNPAESNFPQNEINKVVEQSTAVTVLGGQNSIASETLKKATLPVVISPVQLNVLYKNDEFKEKENLNSKPINEKNLKDIKLDLKPVEQKVSLNGINDSKTGDFAPKAYGYIDLKTGLYVSPEKIADNSTSTALQNEKRIGTIDSETGEYIAPAGLKLDSKKGFIIDGENKDAKTIALKDDLNQNIGTNLIVASSSNDSKFDLNEKFIRDQILFSMFIGDQRIQINQNLSNSPYYEMKADKENINLGLEWRMSSLNRFRTLVGVKLHDVDFSSQLPSNFSSEVNRLYSMYLGEMYALNRNIDAVIKIGEHQEHYVYQSGNDYTLKKMALTKLSLGFHSEFFNENRLNLEVDVNGSYFFKKRLNSQKAKDSLGFDMTIGTRLRTPGHNSILVAYTHESQNSKVSTNNLENRQERNNNGFIIQYMYSY